MPTAGSECGSLPHAPTLGPKEQRDPELGRELKTGKRDACPTLRP